MRASTSATVMLARSTSAMRPLLVAGAHVYDEVVHAATTREDWEDRVPGTSLGNDDGDPVVDVGEIVRDDAGGDLEDEAGLLVETGGLKIDAEHEGRVRGVSAHAPLRGPLEPSTREHGAETALANSGH
ncbi:hypothetical protein [Pseudoclavibacter terrae]|uniref:Uncharacterized protein n=1 Tax=Pseudoclavibacter terrae TaxID=1530195 RepID=A0A7J5B3W2_9MICO|nr:hypothetical protein [Pseudoclavibacter terrae]KAB1638578.1 hypothetical protein F8O03_09385 [Pseudoclavibacter terrae]